MIWAPPLLIYSILGVQAFCSPLMEATGGRGADIVSNSLAGPLLHASWACVAPFGKIIEPGKWNFLLNDMLTL